MVFNGRHAASKNHNVKFLCLFLNHIGFQERIIKNVCLGDKLRKNSINLWIFQIAKNLHNVVRDGRMLYPKNAKEVNGLKQKI
jgi:hypothetical protein